MNAFNKIFKTKLYHHVADVPEDLWSRIESKLPEEKRDLKPLWVMLSFVALFVSGLMTFLYFDGNGSVKLHPNTDSININETIAQHSQSKSSRLNTENLFSTQNKRRVASGEHVNFSTEVPTTSPVQQNESISETINEEIDVDRYIQSSSAIGNIFAGKALKHYHKIIVPTLKMESNNLVCPAISVKKMSRSVEGYFGHDINLRHLHSIATGMTEYVQMREKAENMSYSFSAGFRYNHQINERWSLLSGINYKQINERFQYIDPESNQTREITIKDYVYQNGKIVDSIITKKTEVIPGDKKMDVKNKYRSVDIPLLASYKLYENRNLSLSTVTGVHINIISANKGLIFDTDNTKLLDISANSSTNQPVFKTWLGVSAYGSVNVSYKLSPVLDVFAEPNIRMQMSSITTNQYPLTQKYTTFGALTGMRYTF